MSKEEKIKEAYGEYYDKVKNNIDDLGWCTMINEENVFVSPTCLDLGMTREYYDNNIEGGYFSDSNTHKWRPKSLQGIENNNGWTYISSIHDKEIEKGQYWVMYPNGFIEVAYYDGTMECYKFWKLNFTHYQPIEKPKPPLF